MRTMTTNVWNRFFSVRLCCVRPYVYYYMERYRLLNKYCPLDRGSTKLERYSTAAAFSADLFGISFCKICSNINTYGIRARLETERDTGFRRTMGSIVSQKTIELLVCRSSLDHSEYRKFSGLTSSPPQRLLNPKMHRAWSLEVTPSLSPQTHPIMLVGYLVQIRRKWGRCFILQNVMMYKLNKYISKYIYQII